MAIDVTEVRKIKNLKELRDLRERINTQIRSLERIEAARAAILLEEGQKISFRVGQRELKGTIKKVNSATVSVLDEKNSVRRIPMNEVSIVGP